MKPEMMHVSHFSAVQLLDYLADIPACNPMKWTNGKHVGFVMTDDHTGVVVAYVVGRYRQGGDGLQIVRGNVLPQERREGHATAITEALLDYTRPEYAYAGVSEYDTDVLCWLRDAFGWKPIGEKPYIQNGVVKMGRRYM